MIDCVEIGTAIVAYIEPHPGAERDFNRWYERDHFYAATMAGPGPFAGGRFVATRACKRARPDAGTLFGDPGRGSYLALYWLLPGMQADWDTWVARQMDALVAQDRMFPGRDHLHTAVYRFDAEARAAEGPYAALALDRCFAGVVAVALAPHVDARTAARRLVGARVPVAATFRQERLIVSALGEHAVTDRESHTLLLAFVDGDVLDVWRDDLAPALDSHDVLFASPFLRTVPGTDTYVGEL